MRARLQRLAGAGFLALGLSACPVTDDYFIDPHAATGGSASAGQAGTQAGTNPEGGSAGNAAVAGNATAGGALATGGTGAGTPSAGAADASGGAPELGMAGAPSTTCVPQTERCNGHDDNCNEVIDEQACNSFQNGTTGCAGFVLSGRPDHGYMICTGTQRDYPHAQEACASQDMRLAWIESAEENSALSSKLNGLSNGIEVLIGANDIANEGAWLWDGGMPFWSGNYFGRPVNGEFSAWSMGSPNNSQGSEDCCILSSSMATWNDRNCSGKYAYLCEEAEP